MKKAVLLAFVLVLLSLAVVVGFVRPVTVSLPPVHNIDTDLHYATIQEAINVPQTLDGHTILADAGAYYEHVTINKSISLIGENRCTTTIDGSGIGNVVHELGSTLLNTTDNYDGLWHTTDFTITLTATENLSDVAETYYKINYGPTKKVSIDGQPIITAENANNTLEHWSVDINGNEGAHHVLTDIKLDKTPPIISITSPSDGAEVRSSPMIVWNGADATSGMHHYEIRLDDGSWKWRCIKCAFYTFIEVGDGSHTVKIKAFDEARNLQVASVNFTLNTSPVRGPGYTEEQAIIVVVVLVALATATYLLKIRKKTSTRR
jgi:hypothetical protein